MDRCNLAFRVALSQESARLGRSMTALPDLLVNCTRKSTTEHRTFLLFLFFCCAPIDRDLTAICAQNSFKRAFKAVLDGLNPEGQAVVSALAKDPALRIEGSEPLKDILREGGWTSQTGMDVWRLAGVALVLLRPVLASVPSMVRAVCCPRGHTVVVGETDEKEGGRKGRG